MLEELVEFHQNVQRHKELKPRKTVNNVIININEASTLQQLGVHHINKTYENMTM